MKDMKFDLSLFWCLDSCEAIDRATRKKEKVAVVFSVTPPDQARSDLESDLISLRPQGRNGSTPGISSSPLPSPVAPLISPVKTNYFALQHLRPGFVDDGLQIIQGNMMMLAFK
ncbi:unnamed protein product [Fraxinus pennsylvanica]|uniref:Uncharacterized protein n=1 Tax=Fraxinus pennsylvanica TaxID=56036 RepID=A0AAD2DIL1_9LAMI|nr:unnamed protein product [Fraxinus pennsylvanica]